VRALYDEKGFPAEDSSKLFVIGFTSSAVFGVTAGSLADKYGRKKGALMFSLLYALACLIYHSNDFNTLALGRVCSGIATSLLFSVFEAWYKTEHEKRKFDGSWVSQTFARQTFADGLLAIGAGLTASRAVDYTKLSVTPFDMSAACLVIGGFLVLFWWSENASNSSKEDGASLTSSLRTIFGNREILLCGTVQSLFGGCMYIFVFFWTPALKGCEPGLVFCCFMIAVMIGSGIFEELEKRGWSLVDIVCLVLAGASISFAIPLVTDEIPMLVDQQVGFEG